MKAIDIFNRSNGERDRLIKEQLKRVYRQISETVDDSVHNTDSHETIFNEELYPEVIAILKNDGFKVSDSLGRVGEFAAKISWDLGEYDTTHLAPDQISLDFSRSQAVDIFNRSNSERDRLIKEQLKRIYRQISSTVDSGEYESNENEITFHEELYPEVEAILKQDGFKVSNDLGRVGEFSMKISWDLGESGIPNTPKILINSILWGYQSSSDANINVINSLENFIGDLNGDNDWLVKDSLVTVKTKSGDILYENQIPAENSDSITIDNGDLSLTSNKISELKPESDLNIILETLSDQEILADSYSINGDLLTIKIDTDDFLLPVPLEYRMINTEGTIILSGTINDVRDLDPNLLELLVPNSDYRILNSDSTVLETGSIVSSASNTDLLAPDAQFSWSSSNGAYTGSIDIPSGSSDSLNIPDVDYRILNSDSTVLETGSIEVNLLINDLNAPDAIFTWSNRNNTYTGTESVPSDGSYQLDIPNTDVVVRNQNGDLLSTNSFPSGTSNQISVDCSGQCCAESSVLVVSGGDFADGNGIYRPDGDPLVGDFLSITYTNIETQATINWSSDNQRWELIDENEVKALYFNANEEQQPWEGEWEIVPGFGLVIPPTVEFFECLPYSITVNSEFLRYQATDCQDENIIVTNSLDSTVGTIQGSKLLIDDSTFSINGTVVSNIPAESSGSIQVRRSSGVTRIGGLQGQHWRIDDSNITLNDAAFTSVQAESSTNIKLVDSNNDAITDISISGNKITINELPCSSGGGGIPSALPAPTASEVDEGAAANLYVPGTFHTLPYLNPFGTTSRRTGTAGGYYDYDTNQYKLLDGTVTNRAGAFGGPRFIDWLQWDKAAGKVMMYQVIGKSIYTYANIITMINGMSNGGYTDWFLPTLGQYYDQLEKGGTTRGMNYAPMSEFGGNGTGLFWTSTTGLGGTDKMVVSNGGSTVINRSPTQAGNSMLVGRWADVDTDIIL